MPVNLSMESTVYRGALSLCRGAACCAPSADKLNLEPNRTLGCAREQTSRARQMEEPPPRRAARSRGQASRRRDGRRAPAGLDKAVRGPAIAMLLSDC